MKAYLRMACTAVAVAVAFAAGSATPASAGALTCVENAERPFAAWGDNSPYALAPNGSFEAGASGWSLSGARVVGGNNVYRSGSHSLALPSGSSATSPPTCIRAADPASRFFVRSTGASDGRLRVELRYRTVVGLLPQTSTIGYVEANGSWQPSPKLDHLLDSVLGVLALDNGLGTSVQFRFTPVGRGASFQIDDLFVDPILQI